MPWGPQNRKSEAEKGGCSTRDVPIAASRMRHVHRNAAHDARCAHADERDGARPKKAENPNTKANSQHGVREVRETHVDTHTHTQSITERG